MRKQLNKSEIKELNEKLKQKYNFEYFNPKDNVVLQDNFYYKDGKVALFVLNDEIIPALKILLEKNFLKTITVDMGAIKFVAPGADIMRPGITLIDDVKQGEIVAIVDAVNKKPIAVGKALFDQKEMQAMTKGICVKNIHYVGDEIWVKA